MSRRWATLAAALLAASSARAEAPSLEAVTVEARLEPGAPASVSMSYVLRPAGASAALFESIRFGEARVANVRAFLDGRELPFRMAAGGDSKIGGGVELPAGASGAERLDLRLDYQVLPETALSGARLAIALPLLVSAWPPAQALPETFRATVLVPAGVSVYAAFPTEFTGAGLADGTSGAKAYRFVLPVVPALIRLRASTGEPPRVTAESGLDALAVGLLLGLTAVGWRRLRETLG